jgi:hypothetical protein
MVMIQKTHLMAAALVALLVLGCSTGAKVRLDYDPKEDFQLLRSYAWAPMTAEEQQEKSRNGLIHERIQSAVDAHLAARGYAKVSDTHADFLVTHTVTVESRTQVQETRTTVGYGRYGMHGGVGIGYGFPVESTTYQYKVGTLIIDIIDARQQRLVWRGAGERTLDEEITPEQRTALINATVDEILSRFPPTGEKPK